MSLENYSVTLLLLLLLFSNSLCSQTPLFLKRRFPVQGKIKVHIAFPSETSRLRLRRAAMEKPVAGKVERGGITFGPPPLLPRPACSKPSSAGVFGGVAGKATSGSQKSPFLTGTGVS